MSFADQKKRFLNKYGDPMTIIRACGNVATSARFVKGRQLLSPFEINFIRFMLFSADSGVKCGDLVLNGTTNDQSFVAATQDHTLKGVVTGVYTELYMVNAPTVMFQRFKASADSNLNPSLKTWNEVASAPANANHLSGGEQRKDGLLLPTTVLVITMQAMPDTPILLQDRVVVDGKNYQVDDINLTSAPGLQILQASVDQRK